MISSKMEGKIRSARSLWIGVASTLLVVLTAEAASAGEVLYVDDDAPDGGMGLTWNTAYRYLQNALASAAPGSGVTEIRVAQGTYKPDQGWAQTPGDREASFNLIEGVALVGGYAGYGASDPDDRDVDLYETVLSGDLLGDDADPYENMGDNSGHVLKGIGLAQTTRLDGFTVTRGFAEDGQIETVWAAGLWLEESHVQVVDCSFLQNVSDNSGGGIGFFNGSLRVESCRFVGNKADEWGYSGSGGGIAAYSDDKVSIIDCAFENNIAYQGAGANVQAPAFIASCSFTDNLSNHGFGGGLALIQADAVVRDCRFIDNKCYMRGGGISCAYEGQRMIRDCEFSGNIAENTGGGIAIEVDAHVNLYNCRFEGNSTVYHLGGGVYLDEDVTVHFGTSDFIANTDVAVIITDTQDVSFSDCRFLGNSHDDNSGAALYVGNYHAAAILRNCIFSGNVGEYGAAVVNFEGELEMHNCAVVGNSASEDAGGLWNVRGTANIVNSIFWGNSDQNGITESAQITRNGDGALNISSSCIQELDQYAGPGNIGDDPLLADPDGADDVVGTDDDDLHLLAGSSCIDAGDNAVVLLCGLDLDGAARRWDDPDTIDTGFGDPPVIDMGVFEFGSVFGDDDCNTNGLQDSCEAGEGLTADCNENSIPDDCELDCNLNGIPDDCDIADGTSEDCNDNGVPDECDLDCNGNGIPDDCDIADETSQDCNNNGIPDECDILYGYREDCNANGIPDECDLADGTSEDCNGNGMPDECEVLLPVVATSGPLSPIGVGYPQSHTISSPPVARTEVLLQFAAHADLSKPTTEYIDVDINGTYVGRLYDDVGSDCPVWMDFDYLLLDAAAFNDIVAGGDAIVTMSPYFEVNPDECDVPTFIALEVSYSQSSDLDQNGDGIPDECECPADLNSDLTVNIDDLFAVLGVWGTCDDCPEDINNDGTVDIDDLFEVLAAWGPCP